MLFGCKLSLAMVSTSVSVRSSDRLPSEGTSVVVAGVVVFEVEVEEAESSIGTFVISLLVQAASPRIRQTLMNKRFTPARL